MYKYIIAGLSLITVTSTIYALTIETNPLKIIEKENRQKVIECLEDVHSFTGTAYQLQKEIGKCTKLELVSITGTHSTGITVPPPKGVERNIVGIAEKKSPTKSIKASSGAGVQSGTHTESVKENQFWTTYDLAIPLIRKYEGLALKAYKDPKLCSIGYGTRAKSCSEVITQAEADKRLGGIVKQLVTRVQRDFPTLTSRQQAGLVSFAFNCEKGYRDVKKRGLLYHKYWCRTASGVKLQGLVNRRLEEQIMLFE